MEPEPESPSKLILPKAGVGTIVAGTFYSGPESKSERGYFPGVGAGAVRKLPRSAFLVCMRTTFLNDNSQPKTSLYVRCFIDLNWANANMPHTDASIF